MAKKVGDYRIPFSKDGNQLHYPDFVHKWVDNTPFEDTLTYKGFSRGRSAAYFNFERANGKTVTVFLKELDEMLPRMVDAKISGTFAFVKRGENYGCAMQRPFGAPNAAVAAIQYALEECDDSDDAQDFLRYWHQGDFEILRRNWKDVPAAVFIGADPLYKPAEPS